MSAPFYVGDEATAAGFRMAGVRALVPERGAEADAFAQACAEASLVMLCASIAARLDAERLRSALVAAKPPCVVLPDLHAEVALPDIAARLRSQLGLEA